MHGASAPPRPRWRFKSELTLRIMPFWLREWDGGQRAEASTWSPRGRTVLQGSGGRLRRPGGATHRGGGAFVVPLRRAVAAW